MADWDIDSARLRANLETVFEELSRWSEKRGAFTVATIKSWHRKTMRGLEVPHPKFIGRFRGEAGLEHEPVYIGTHRGTDASLVPKEVAACVKRLQSILVELDEILPKGGNIDRDRLEACIELAAWTHSEWVRIHPFCNGNGRTARMLANAILMRYGLPPVLRLRPRPGSPYGQAGAHGMMGNSKPMEALLRGLLAKLAHDD
ncbi:MAG: Fic family protein [Burkholderiales bacterium]